VRGGMRGLVTSVYFEAHCHATEDVGKVRAAMLNLIPPSLRGSIKITQERVEGYYGNPIVVMRAAVGDGAEEVVEYLSNLMSVYDRRELSDTLALRVDDSNNFYVRVDKQWAYRGEARVADHDDVIKIRISLSSRIRGLVAVREALAQLGLVE